MKNAFSIDVEDWFCVKNLSHRINYLDWGSCELRIMRSMEKILTLLHSHNVSGTFFTLGWIAERLPELVPMIASGGHEIATHGYAHIFVKLSTPDVFEKDLHDSLQVLRTQTNSNVQGFRAPSFSVDPKLTWIFDILTKHGIRYDSSIYPVSFHPDYGSGAFPLSAHLLYPDMTELPMSCFTIGKMNFPVSGGGYFRLFPYSYTSFGLKRCNKQGRPAVFYLHPWELDPDQPRMHGLGVLKSLRHYYNLSKTEERLHRLLNEFEFTTCANILGL